MRISTTRSAGLIAAAVLFAAMAAGSALAADLKIYDDGELALVGCENPGGVTEPAVPTYYGGILQGSFKVLEAYDKVPGQVSWPLTVAELVANTYLRPTYQLADGSSAPLGTSVVGTASYRTAAGLQYIPSVSQTDVFIGGSDRLRTVLDAQFGTDAQVASACTFPDPLIESTAVGLTIGFEAKNAVALDAAQLGNDAFRLGSLSSMFASESQYDANILRWEDPAGAVHTLQLTNATPRDAHLFASPQEIAVGGFFELLKEPGSTWYPTSPSMRVDLVSLTGVTGRVGIQGWLAATTAPNDDSLSVWLEWIDALATIPLGAAYEATYLVTASPIPEPATLALLAAGAVILWTRDRSRGYRAAGDAGHLAHV